MTALLIDLQVAHALLGRAVVVGVECESGLLSSDDHDLGDGRTAAVIIDVQRPADTAVFIGAAGEVL